MPIQGRRLDGQAMLLLGGGHATACESSLTPHSVGYQKPALPRETKIGKPSSLQKRASPFP